MMRTSFVVAAALLAGFAGAPDVARAEVHAEAQVQATNPLEVTADDIAIGNSNAPLTVIEYASLTCSHCAHFHNDTFEEVKKNYVDTGKVRFVFRHMPWDNMALAAAKLAVCAHDTASSYISAFFKTQETWAKSADPLAELKKVAKLGGMDEATADKCLQNAQIHQQVLDIQNVGRDVLKVRSTPTLFVGKNTVIEGFRDYAAFSKVLDDELAKVEAADKAE
ncbi:MAG: thioredoxin domain-containing protein [Proteobacteria bacterium]|nr:thioredoxin domain-containing protein [Pseudomonadota bacterium]